MGSTKKEAPNDASMPRSGRGLAKAAVFVRCANTPPWLWNPKLLIGNSSQGGVLSIDIYIDSDSINAINTSVLYLR